MDRDGVFGFDGHWFPAKYYSCNGFLPRTSLHFLSYIYIYRYFYPGNRYNGPPSNCIRISLDQLDFFPHRWHHLFRGCVHHLGRLLTCECGCNRGSISNSQCSSQQNLGWKKWKDSLLDATGGDVGEAVVLGNPKIHVFFVTGDVLTIFVSSAFSRFDAFEVTTWWMEPGNVFCLEDLTNVFFCWKNQ